MTVTGSRAFLLLSLLALSLSVASAESALTLHANAAGADVPLTIELFRWSTDAERAPMLAAMAPPAAAPPSAAVPAAGASDGGGRGGRGGRAGRGGRGGGGNAAPANPLARLTTAVKAAPTLGFIWGSGVTGYSIKYAWHAPADGGRERIVLVTERRLGEHVPEWTPAPAVTPDAEFTLVEMRVDAKGVGEGKASLTTNVALDAKAQTLALDGYETAPVLLKVSR